MEKSLMEPTKESMILAAALNAMQGIEGRVTSLEGEMVEVRHQLAKEVHITSSHAVTLTKAVHAKVMEVCGEKHKELKDKVYRALWRDVKREFDVPVYRDIPRNKIDIAMKIVREWKYLGADSLN